MLKQLGSPLSILSSVNFIMIVVIIPTNFPRSCFCFPVLNISSLNGVFYIFSLGFSQNTKYLFLYPSAYPRVKRKGV